MLKCHLFLLPPQLSLRWPGRQPLDLLFFHPEISSHFQVKRRKPQTQRAFGRCSPRLSGRILPKSCQRGWPSAKASGLLLFHTFFGSWGWKGEKPTPGTEYQATNQHCG